MKIWNGRGLGFIPLEIIFCCWISFCFLMILHNLHNASPFRKNSNGPHLGMGCMDVTEDVHMKNSLVASTATPRESAFRPVHSFNHKKIVVDTLEMNGYETHSVPTLLLQLFSSLVTTKPIYCVKYCR